MLRRASSACRIFYLVWTVLILIINCLKKYAKQIFIEWAGLRRSIPLSLRSYDSYPSTNSPIDVTKGKPKDYYNLLLREKAKPPDIIQKLQSTFHFNSDNLKQIFKLQHSIVVESYVKAFQYKVINSILYTNTKLFKIGFRTNDFCTFGDNQPESLTHLFYHCSRSKHWVLEWIWTILVPISFCGALFRINEFVSAWKMCSLEFWRKILALYFNCWTIL